jgi:hypothetical protein
MTLTTRITTAGAAAPEGRGTAVALSSDRVRAAANLAFWILLGVGFALRVYFVFSKGFTMNSDHAVVYLMARNVAEGEFPAFFWGQSYGGSVLPLTAGIFMMIFGPSIQLLAITSALWWAGAAVVLRFVTAASIGPVAGVTAGLLFWFPGLVILSVSVVDPGFYGPSLLFGLAVVLVAVRRPTARFRVVDWVVAGIFAGLSLWASPMAIAIAAPAVVFMVWRDRRWRFWMLGVSAALLAATPWILETLRSSFSSVKPLGGTSRFHPESLASIFTAMFPAAFPGSSNELVRFAVTVLALALIVALIHRSVITRNSAAIVVTVGMVFVIGVLIVGSGVRLAEDSVRYSAFLIPGLSFAVAWLLVERVRISAVAAGAAVAVTMVTVLVVGNGLAPAAQTPFSTELTAVGEYLESRGINAVYGSYWISYSLSAVTDERVTVASLGPRRYERYEAVAAEREPMSVVVFVSADNDTVLTNDSSLPSHDRAEFGGFAVLTFDEWFDIYQLELSLN